MINMLIGANKYPKNIEKGEKNFKIYLKIGAYYDMIHVSHPWRFIYGTNCIA